MTAPIDISEFQADYLDTERATEQTVQAMCQHIRECAGDPEIAAIVAGYSYLDARRHCARLWLWCKQYIRFVSDEEQLKKLLGRTDELELLISPSVLVRARVREGDCDDFTMMLCSMLVCLGITPLVKTFKCDRDEPWRWSHVCAAAALEDGTVVTLDATPAGEYPGWEIPAQDVYASQLWNMNGQKVGNSRGLSGYVPEPGWTGQQATSRGSVAGPYASRDFSQMYGRRRGMGRYAGLRGMGRRKWGVGDAGDDVLAGGGSDAFDTTPLGTSAGDVTSSTSYGTSDIIGSLATTPPASTVVYLNSDGSVSMTPSGPSSTATTLGLISALIPAATKLTQQAIATPGTVILPNGTIAVGTAAGTPSIGTSISTALGSNGILIIGLVIGGVLLVSAMSGKK